jgi:hypothetical protein
MYLRTYPAQSCLEIELRGLWIDAYAYIYKLQDKVARQIQRYGGLSALGSEI